MKLKTYYCDTEFQQIEHENYSRLNHSHCTYSDSDMYSTIQHGTKKSAPAFCNPALVDTYTTIKLGNQSSLYNSQINILFFLLSQVMLIISQAL